MYPPPHMTLSSSSYDMYPPQHAYRGLATHIMDEYFCHLDPASVREGDIVFVNSFLFCECPRLCFYLDDICHASALCRAQRVPISPLRQCTISHLVLLPPNSVQKQQGKVQERNRLIEFDSSLCCCIFPCCFFSVAILVLCVHFFTYSLIPYLPR